MEIFNERWEQTTAVGGIRYTCGYCGTDTAPASGYYSNQKKGHVLICTFCNQPSFIIREGGKIISITPSPKMGKEINGLPDDVKALYDEARLCTSAHAYTAAVLVCRKILMHIAVEKKAEPNIGLLTKK